MQDLIPIQIQLWWELFVLFMPILPFALPFLLALAPTGWRSLAVAGLLCAVCAVSMLADMHRGRFTLSPMSVREGYIWHLALLPVFLGLVAGMVLRAHQLRYLRPRLSWLTVGVFLAGMLIRPNPWIEIYKANV